MGLMQIGAKVGLGDLGRCAYLALGQMKKEKLEISVIGLDGVGGQLPFNRQIMKEGIKAGDERALGLPHGKDGE